MNKHKVIIRETLEREVEIEADSKEEALDIVIAQYNRQEIILDSSDFINKEIFLEEEEPLPLLHLSKDDIRMEGYLCDNMSKQTLFRLGSRITDGVMDSFWSVLNDFCRNLNMKHKEQVCEEAETIMQDKYGKDEIYFERIPDCIEFKDEYQDEFNELCDELETKYNSIIY